MKRKHPNHPQDRRSNKGYRPSAYHASTSEAKEILKNRYKKCGFKVIRITRRDWHFIVSFGEDSNGRGKGPGGLKCVMCNWPYFENAKTPEEALKLRGIEPPPKKRRRRRR